MWGRLSDAASNPRRLLQIALIGCGLATMLLSQQTVLLWIALLYALQAMLWAALSPLSDTLVLSLAHVAGFGSVRLWGSLGWAVVVMIAGTLIQRRGLTVGFVGALVVYLAAAVIVNGIPHRTSSQQDPTGRVRTSTRAILRELLREPEMLGLALALIILGVTGRSIIRFEPIYLDQLGAPEIVIGFASTLGATVELPGMLWADRLVRHHGARPVLRAGVALQAVRMLAILTMPSVPLIVGMRIVEGVSFSLVTVSLVVYISNHTPTQQVTTMLALFGITLSGLVDIVAAPFGGAIFDAVVAYWLYAVALGGIVVASAVLWSSRQATRTRRASRFLPPGDVSSVR